MPLFDKFRSSTIFNAFVLNSIASTMAIVVSALVQKYISEGFSGAGSFVGFILNLAMTFITYMIGYGAMYFLFGFGSGMLETPTPTPAPEPAPEPEPEPT